MRVLIGEARKPLNSPFQKKCGKNRRKNNAALPDWKGRLHGDAQGTKVRRLVQSRRHPKIVGFLMSSLGNAVGMDDLSKKAYKNGQQSTPLLQPKRERLG